MGVRFWGAKPAGKLERYGTRNITIEIVCSFSILPWAIVNTSADSLRCQGMYFRDWDNYRKALSVVHTLQRFKIYSDMKTFWNRHVDFIGTELEPSAVIAAMHSLTLLITGNMQKFYCPEEIGVVLLHALRHCVPSQDKGHWFMDRLMVKSKRF